MKLELFDFIDETLELIESRKDEIEKVADQLEKFFNDSFFINDHFLNVSYRIKSLDSLREKILRHNFYIKYKTPENVLDNLSDLIGFRIECRFIQDEDKIYKDIVKLFKIDVGDGFYTNPLNSNIMLRLGVKQPQKQKNGFEIYKLDGKYCKDGACINFELQIKSLVNVFWGEIDHRVLYKNFNYMLTEGFFRDIMSSIKDNLSMIDRQLMLVFDHLKGEDTSNDLSKRVQIQALLSKIIHDIYILKIKEEIGFVLDFKKSTDLIVSYLFMKNTPERSNYHSENFIRIMDRLNQISKDSISFNKYIDFEREIVYQDEFTEKIGNSILERINKDFRWNLFFKIIFEIEESRNSYDFQQFTIFIRDRFSKEIDNMLATKELQESQEEIKNCIMASIAESFSVETDVDYFCDCNINSLNQKIEKKLKRINSSQDWLTIKDDITDMILNHKTVWS